MRRPSLLIFYAASRISRPEMLRLPGFTLLAGSLPEHILMQAWHALRQPPFSAYALIFQRIQIPHITDHHQCNLECQCIIKNTDI